MVAESYAATYPLRDAVVVERAGLSVRQQAGRSGALLGRLLDVLVEVPQQRLGAAEGLAALRAAEGNLGDSSFTSAVGLVCREMPAVKVSPQVAALSKAPGAQRASVRLVTGVRVQVSPHVTGPTKALRALCAAKRLFTGVRAKMTTKVATMIKAFAAQRASVRFFSSVRAQVRPHVTGPTKVLRARALFAAKRLVASVRAKMTMKGIAPPEALATHRASVGFVAGVCAKMTSKGIAPPEALAANSAMVGFVAGVRAKMTMKAVAPLEALATQKAVKGRLPPVSHNSTKAFPLCEAFGALRER